MNKTVEGKLPETVTANLSGQSQIASEISLHGNKQKSTSKTDELSYYELLDRVIHDSIETVREFHENQLYVEDVREIESVIFIKALAKTISEYSSSSRIPEQLRFIKNLIGLFSFQIQNRKYSCIKHDSSSINNRREKDLNNVLEIINKQFSTNRTTLKDYPSREEIISLIVDQISESHFATENQDRKILDENIVEVHPARRGGIINWINRYHDYVEEKYNHDTGIDFEFSLPIVWACKSESNNFLLLLIISGLDPNLLDDMVTEDQKCPEISLGLFDIRNLIMPLALDDLEFILQQSFGRFLFSNMQYESNGALNFSLNNRSSVLRYWITQASKGLEGVLHNTDQKDVFHSMDFCQALVENVLCNEIPGNNSEIYPFDRAIIIKESAASIKDNLLEPIQVKFLEASIQSNKPEDRGRFLTRNERRIRETEDTECNPAMKQINQENVFSFYIHPHSDGLIVSRQKNIPNEVLKEVTQLYSSPRSQIEPQDRYYYIPIDEYEGDLNVSSALYSIIGRLLPGNVEERKLDDPAGIDDNLFGNIRTFSKEFETIRLDNQQKYNSSGLLFEYQHGVNLSEDFPLLHRIQSAYFDNINKVFEIKNFQHINDRYKQYNLSPEQLIEIQQRYKLKEKNERENNREAKDFYDDIGNAISQYSTSKIVMISFSSELHDENVSFNTSSKDAERTVLPLGSEFNFTLLLISDNDPEKTRAQLIHEKDDFELFVSILLDRIYQDRRNEISKFAKRSQIINNSLSQFFHRFKSLAKDSKSRKVIEDELANLKPLLDLSSTHKRYIRVTSMVNIFALLFASNMKEGEKLKSDDQLKAVLTNRIYELCPNIDHKRQEIDVNVQTSHIPEIDLLWSTGVIREAFDNILKNSYEAAYFGKGQAEKKFINLRVEIIPVTVEAKSTQFLDIIIENSGGPISQTLIKKLNDNDPEPLSESGTKPISSGLGVFISRFLLINEMANGSDLIYMNLSDGIVQTRLRLPMKIQSDVAVKEQSKRTPPKTGKKFILYVEDTKSIYENELKKLSEVFAPYGIEIIHSRSYEQAVEIMTQQYPIALLMDLTILKNEEGSTSPQMSFGLSLVQYFCDLSIQKNRFAPLWILTNEKGSIVSERLSQVISPHHHVVISKNAQPEALLKSGAVYILSEEIEYNKQPHKYPFINKFLDSLTSTETGKQQEVFTEQDIVEIPMNEVESLEKVFNTQISGNTASLFLVVSEHSDEKSLLSAIRRWFQHPGLPNPDPIFMDPTKLYKLYDHVYHQSVLNILVINGHLINLLSARYLYWALSKNIWFEGKNHSSEEIAYKWKRLKMEERGPLSKLRHDIKNRWNTTELLPLSTKFVEIVNVLESQLLFSPDQQKEIDLVLNGKSDDCSVMFSKEESTSEIRANISKLGQLFQLYLETKSSINNHEETNQMRELLQTLGDYLGE